MDLQPSRSAKRIGKSGISFFAALLALLFFSVPAAQAATTAAGDWHGSINVPVHVLEIGIHLSENAGAWSGTIDIPTQNLRGFALGEVKVEGEKVSFTMPGIPGNPTFDGTLSGDTLDGTFTQGQASFTFKLERGSLAPLIRPQEPKPPFPYKSENVTYKDGPITLAGTLTLPRGKGPFPAVVLISGSGAQNRDEEIFGHRPFLVLADRLTRAGIAVLRSDDRGVGGSSGNVAESTTADFASDALAAVARLDADPRIDPARIGLLGHSEGGLVAVMAAARPAGQSRVHFIVLVATPGVSGGAVLMRQIERLSVIAGAPKQEVDRRLADERQILDAVEKIEDPNRLGPAIKKILTDQVVALPEATRKALGGTKRIVETQLAQVMTPWFRAFVRYSPVTDLEKIRVPVLAIDGTLDVQVDGTRSLPAIKQALAKGGNHDITTKEFKGLNHLMQPAKTGLPNEYSQIETTIAPGVLKLITHWIAAQTGLASPAQSGRL